MMNKFIWSLAFLAFAGWAVTGVNKTSYCKQYGEAQSVEYKLIGATCYVKHKNLYITQNAYDQVVVTKIRQGRENLL